jgi:hypothetical protein
VSPGTRFDASEMNATYRPLPEMFGSKLRPLACRPPEVNDTRWVVPLALSRTNTSGAPLVSPATKFDASEKKAT